MVLVGIPCHLILARTGIISDLCSGDLLNDQEVLTYRSDLIFRNYLRGWFTIDLLSILPWEYMMMGITLVFGYSNSSISAAPRLLKLFRLTRLFKLIRMHRLVKVRTQEV